VLTVDSRPDATAQLLGFLVTAKHVQCRFTATSCASLGAAIAALEYQDADVVLVDLARIESSGLDSLRSLAESHGHAQVIAIADELPAKPLPGVHEHLTHHETTPTRLATALHNAATIANCHRQLHTCEQRFALLVNGTNDGIWEWVVGEDRVFLSPTLKRILGLETETSRYVNLKKWTRCVDSRDLPGLHAALVAHVNGATTALEHEHRVATGPHAGEWVLVRGTAQRNHTGQAVRLAGSVTDISKRKLVEAQLAHGALHDSLTQLPNRALLLDRLGQLLRRTRRSTKQRFAVLYISINRFKSVNELHGRTIGDALLVGVARRLEASVRPEDTLARLSGDEYGLLLTQIPSHDQAQKFAARTLELLKQPYFIEQHHLEVQASIGLVHSDTRYRHPEELLRDADIALYQAKADPAAPLKVFSTQMRSSILARRQLEADLNHAAERGELAAFYQPIVALDTGEVVGFEALVRWNHPRRGALVPDAFLPIAEENGAIVPISWWMLEEAARQIAQWQRLFPKTKPLTMSVNISGKLFAERNVLKQMQALISGARPAPFSLHLEITESVALDHTGDVLAILAGVRALGVSLDVDDFGTGYASLTYLQRFCYDVLKIDRSFVAQLSQHKDSNAIVRALVALARSLNMTVVAEGVESRAQLKELQALKCEQAQGFLFAKPMPSNAIASLLEDSGGEFSFDVPIAAN
jgi:diguanylate cyclase (GGDEF)-like protein